MFPKKLSFVRNLLGLIMVLSVLLSACQATPPATLTTKEATQAAVPQRRLQKRRQPSTKSPHVEGNGR